MFEKAMSLTRLLIGLEEKSASPAEVLPADIQGDSKFLEIYQQCRPYTMVSVERLYANYKAIHYIIENKIPGDIVECGTWKGGSMMAFALTLLALGDLNRNLFCFDTFEGMTEPTEKDVDLAGRSATTAMHQSGVKAMNEWCAATEDEVRKNLERTKYPRSRIITIKGKVEDTIPKTLPSPIAILRLDTDWYESTNHELKHLYPELVRSGVLIIDDFGHWQGSQEATLKYNQQNNLGLFFSRIDSTGVLAIKK